MWWPEQEWEWSPVRRPVSLNEICRVAILRLTNPELSLEHYPHLEPINPGVVGNGGSEIHANLLAAVKHVPEPGHGGVLVGFSEFCGEPPKWAESFLHSTGWSEGVEVEDVIMASLSSLAGREVAVSRFALIGMASLFPFSGMGTVALTMSLFSSHWENPVTWPSVQPMSSNTSFSISSLVSSYLASLVSLLRKIEYQSSSTPLTTSLNEKFEAELVTDQMLAGIDI